jgi:hypothetical protein
MWAGDFCAASCGRCRCEPAGACHDYPPSASPTAAALLGDEKAACADVVRAPVFAAVAAAGTGRPPRAVAPAASSAAP